MSQALPNRLGRWQQWHQRYLWPQLLAVLTGSWLRPMVLLIATVTLAVLLFVYVWRPMQAGMQLPPGVVSTNIELNEVLLEQVTAQEVARTTYSPRGFGAPRTLLVAPGEAP